MGLFKKTGDGETFGYNYKQINELRELINNTTQDVEQLIVNRIKSDIIVPMLSAWYAPESINYFYNFNGIIEESSKNITFAFDTFRHEIESFVGKLSFKKNGIMPIMSAIKYVELDLKISDIMLDTEKKETINEEQTSKIINKLSEIENEIILKIEESLENLNTATSFVGYGQSTSIQKCSEITIKEVNKIFKYLKEGDKSLKVQISDYIEKHSNSIKNN